MGFKLLEKNKIVIGGAVLCCSVMVLYPEVTATASREAIGLWLNAIVPALLPFFIAANFLKATGAAGRIPAGIYPVIMAFLSGYPMGARISGDYYRGGYITKAQLRHILSYSMITGPAFLIGAVGVEFLGSHRLGMTLAAGHYGAALVNGLIYSGGAGGGGIKAPGRAVRTDSYYNLLTDAILDSFRAISIILAYIIMFMIAADMLQFSGLMGLVHSAEAEALVKGMLEMTVGTSSLTMSAASDTVRATLASFIISFGGLSVLGQSMSMLRGCDIGFLTVLKIKLTHGMVSAIFTFSICCFVLS